MKKNNGQSINNTMSLPELVLVLLREKLFSQKVQIKDSTGAYLNNFQLLTRIHLIANKIRIDKTDTHVGIILPASIPSVVARIAVMSSARSIQPKQPPHWSWMTAGLSVKSL